MKGGEIVWIICHIMNILQKVILFGRNIYNNLKIGIKEKCLFTT